MAASVSAVLRGGQAMMNTDRPIADIDARVNIASLSALSSIADFQQLQSFSDL
jgi:hypothetical protein